jgi:hypothetical protein
MLQENNSQLLQQKNNSQLLNGNIISNNILVDPTEKGSEQLSGFTVSKETLTALEDCRWIRSRQAYDPACTKKH